MNNCKPPASKLRQFLKKFGDGIPDKEILAATTKQKMNNWTVYCDKEGIVSAARYDPNDWYLCTLKNAAVRTDRRGKGIGRKLYLEVTKKALKLRTKEGYHRCQVLAADVTVDNKPSIKALKRAGFKIINRFCWGKGQKPADILHYVRMRTKKDARYSIGEKC